MKQILKILSRIGGAILMFVSCMLAALFASIVIAIRVLRGEVTAKQMFDRLNNGGEEVLSKHDII